MNNIKFSENINNIITEFSHIYMKISTAFYNIADDINRGFVKILNTNEFEINKINELIDNFITIYTKIRTELNFEELLNYLSNKILLEEVNIKHKIFSIDNKKSEKKGNSKK